MNIGVNQFCFPMSYDVADAVKAAKRLGFDSIEVCFTAADGARPGGGVTDALDISGYHNRLLNMGSTDKDVRELKKLADDTGIRISSVGGIVSFSIYPLTATDAQVAQKSMDAVKKMLDFARILGADTILVIPGMLTADMEYKAAYDLAQSRVAQLAAYAPDIQLAIENVWNGMLYSPLEMSRFVDETGRSNVGVYFDIANARRFGWPQQWIRTLGRRIRQFHCKDYRMSVDTINGFTNLLDGDVDWPEVMTAIRETGYNGELVVELVPPSHYLVENTLTYAQNTLRDFLK
ncbi:MAG: sugar phosphate isomerase/epimerase family protein [Candidatus Limiplasma sp.]|nr:sugar phosphate isomerase/epimerase family protein [Candidatus Limiplasma sp.]